MADTTADRGYPYPETSDTIDVPGDIQALADAVDADVEGLVDPDVETTTANIGTVAANFSVTDVRAATLLGGKLVNVDLYIARTGADITATGGNITDTLMFTLAAAYRPSHAQSCSWGNGVVAGEAIINADGTINLRSSNGNITGTAGTGLSSIRLSASYILS
jgi:hypothetical protein